MPLDQDIARARAIFAAETELLKAWVEKKPCISSLEIDCEQLLIRVVLVQPETGEQFYLEGDFNDYRALPPIFTFSSAPWNRSNQRCDYPKPTDSNPFGGSSIFHPHPCICVNFNRNAYSVNGGPHNDWNYERWLTAVTIGNSVRASNIPDMFSVIYTRFVYTRGRLQ